MSLGALTALVVVETIVLALLAVVVVALLRSHAEMLRRLPAPDDERRERSRARRRGPDRAGTDVVLVLPAHLPRRGPSARPTTSPARRSGATRSWCRWPRAATRSSRSCRRAV